ncbi:MAG: hypothetical protein ACE5DT_02090 [Nitrosopumilus sp.]
MVKTTRLTKQNEDMFKIEIPEEYISKLGWRNGHVLKIDVENEKIIIEKLSGFMGM